MKLTANARRSDGWWVIDVPEVPALLLKARRLDLVEDVVRAAVATEADVLEATIEVDLMPSIDEQVERALDSVRASRAEPVATPAKEIVALRYAARVLTAADLSSREIGAVLGLPPQQARMLVESAEVDARAARAMSRRSAAKKADAMAPMKAQKEALRNERNARLKAARSSHGTDPSADGMNPPPM
jgi:hypothetical protein